MNFLTRLSKRKGMDILLIISVVLGSTALIYLPFVTDTLQYLGFKSGASMQEIYQNYDGLYYLVPAVSWYSPEAITAMRLEFSLPLEYYAAHLPLYPFFIALIAPIFGLLKSMLAVTILFSIVGSFVLYYLVKKLTLSESPLLLIFVFLFLPRFLIVRSIGAPETLFIALILGSIFCFEHKRYFWAGLFGGLSVMTKTPGILLFVAYGLVFLEEMFRHKSFSFRWFWILLIPAGLLAVFSLYALQYQNFFAFFNTGGVVPMPYLFSVFQADAKWVDTIWVEEILLYFFFYLLAVISLWKSKHRSLFYFPLVFLGAASFVQHRDLSRYMLPLWPFALIAFERLFTSKRFLLALCILLPALYLYAWNFLQYNIIPVADWRPFL